jgi:hypothetical protein
MIRSELTTTRERESREWTRSAETKREMFFLYKSGMFLKEKRKAGLLTRSEPFTAPRPESQTSE